ncbi:hypothetical protein [Pseudomonas sp. NFR16]|uniref:hypothetical protein n=1 Tax=Pseudomonas sp. NFR16 TaxID=1566248 RepID=UPI001160CE5E|nr:hypothetical protein [Pseudomonas sp. NFR16]
MNKLNMANLTLVVIMLPSPFLAIWSMVVCHRTVDQLEAILGSSRLVIENRASMKYLGLAGKVLRCGAIIAICFYPGIYVRDGSVVEKEVLAIPKALKRRLYAPFIACTLWSVVFCVWNVLGR